MSVAAIGLTAHIMRRRKVSWSLTTTVTFSSPSPGQPGSLWLN